MSTEQKRNRRPNYPRSIEAAYQSLCRHYDAIIALRQQQAALADEYRLLEGRFEDEARIARNRQKDLHDATALIDRLRADIGERDQTIKNLQYISESRNTMLADAVRNANKFRNQLDRANEAIVAQAHHFARDARRETCRYDAKD